MTSFFFTVGWHSLQQWGTSFGQFVVKILTCIVLNCFSRLEANTNNNFNQLSASDTDIWTMPQKEKESLRSFIRRIKTKLPNVVVTNSTSIYALRNALWHESCFCEELLLNKPVTLEYTLHRALRNMEIEEKNKAFAKNLAPTSKSKEKAQEDNDDWRRGHRE